MTPEEQKLTDRISALEDMVKKLNNSTTIPLEIDVAFRDRLGVEAKATGIVSGVSPTAHNKTVNEAGTNTYPVMNIPTGFLQFTLSGNTYIVPYF